jgi:hypothetical protein
MKLLPASARNITLIITATVLGFGIAVGGTPPALAQVNDPSIPCDNTNNQYGDSQFCYTGPRTPQSSGRARSAGSDAGTPSQAHAHATMRHSRPGGNVERSRRRGKVESVPN